MLTVNGIYTDIYESTYYYDVDNIRFYFSSKVYCEKFAKRFNDYCINEGLKLDIRYNTNIDSKYLMLVKLYTMIEKRGFRIEIDGKKLENIPLFKVEYII